jgi:hypothetical protein
MTVNFRKIVAATEMTILALLTWGMLAQTAHSYPVLSPPEFDRPYPGELIVEENLPQEELLERCHLDKDAHYIGCALVPGHRGQPWGRCTILSSVNAPHDPEGHALHLRHEIAHCNGWRHPVDRDSPEWKRDEEISAKRLIEEKFDQPLSRAPGLWQERLWREREAKRLGVPLANIVDTLDTRPIPWGDFFEKLEQCKKDNNGQVCR